ncbi:MAG TPA: hypothetical protein VH678_01850 [Xanthobacteraceae bacterium]|jgi:hypothetical protein
MNPALAKLALTHIMTAHGLLPIESMVCADLSAGRVRFSELAPPALL